jgi:hypothetical protein
MPQTRIEFESISATLRGAEMSKRYAILGLGVFLALALAVPALGGPSNPVATVSASVKKTASKALKIAKGAKTTANSALSAASSAQSEASKALTEAKKGVTNAATAQSTANAAKTAAEAAQGTANEAKTAAASAEANANNRIKESTEVVGTPSAEDTTPSKFASASCGSNTVLGGGYSVGGENNKITVTQSEEQLYGGGWFVAGQTISGQTANWAITAIAICGTK